MGDLWRRFVTWLDLIAERRTRIAVAMAIIATFSAAAAYRASLEERKSSTCEHQLGEALTYELVQRQRYLDAAVEYERWSDRYYLGALRSSVLLQHATAVRETGRVLANDTDPGLLDVEAQIEASLTRTIEPVRDFTNPNLVRDASLERALRARATQDMKELGISNRCAVHDEQSYAPERRPNTQEGTSTYDDYLDGLRRHIASIHRKSIDDALSVIWFVSALVLFTLSEVVPAPRSRWISALAIAAVPASLYVAVSGSDEGLLRYLLTPSIMLTALVIIGWVFWQFDDIKSSAASNAEMNIHHAGSETENHGFQQMDIGEDEHRTPEAAPSPHSQAQPKDRGEAAGALTELLRRFRLVIAIAYASLLAVVAIMWFIIATQTIRVGPIFLPALVLLVTDALAAWYLVDGVRQTHTRRTLAPGMLASKAVFRYAWLVLGGFGMFVFIVPVAAFLVETRSPWLRTLNWSALVLALVFAAAFVLTNAQIRRRLHDRSVLEFDQDVIERSADSGLDARLETHAFDGDFAPAEPPDVSIDSAEGSPAKYVHFHASPTRNRFANTVVSLIALTAVSSALLTYRYTHEAGEANSFATKAADQQLGLMRTSSRQGIVAYRTIEALTGLREVRLRAAAAGQLRNVAASNAARDTVAIWDHENRRTATTAEVFESRDVPDPNDFSARVPLPQVFNGDNGPDNDTTFPAKLFAASTVRASSERLALWDAYDEANTAVEGRADILLAGGTFFAIALYLFGQSLGMGRRNRGGYVLAVMGSMLFLSGVGVAWYAMTRPIPGVDQVVALPERCRTGEEAQDVTIAEAAAICYGRAESLRALAQKPEDYKRAQDAYETATLDSMRPNFVLAHYRSIRTLSQTESPQRSDFVSIVKNSALSRIVQREGRLVHDLPERDRVVPGSLRESFGFHEYLSSLDGNKRNLLNDSIVDLRSAIQDLEETGDTEASAKFRLSAALLAAASTADAKDSNEAFKLALYAPVRGYDVPAAAISDLELLRTVCPFKWNDRPPADSARSARATHAPALQDAPQCRLLRQVINYREAAVVRTIWPTPNVKVPRAEYLTAQATPSGIAWRLRLSRKVPRDIALVAIVYQLDPDRKVWFVLPSASGIVESDEAIQRDGFTIEGFHAVLVRSRPVQCLDDSTAYRIELRAGGEVLARRRVAMTGGLAHLGGVALYEQGLALCLPDGADGWLRAPTHSDHLEASYRSRDGRAGTDTFAFFTPRHASPDPRGTAQQRAIDDALQRLQGRGLAGRRLHVSRDECPAEAMPESNRVAYTIGSLVILTKTWPSSDGLVHVGLVWHEDRAASRERAIACRVLSSMHTLDARHRQVVSRP